MWVVLSSAIQLQLHLQLFTLHYNAFLFQTFLNAACYINTNGHNSQFSYVSQWNKKQTKIIIWGYYKQNNAVLLTALAYWEKSRHFFVIKITEVLIKWNKKLYHMWIS